MFSFVVCSGILIFYKLIFQKSFPINRALVLSPIFQTTSNFANQFLFLFEVWKKDSTVCAIVSEKSNRNKYEQGKM